jgi:hypothetical protein
VQRLAKSREVQSLTDERERVVRTLETRQVELTHKLEVAQRERGKLEASLKETVRQAVDGVQEMRARLEAEQAKRERIETFWFDSLETERTNRAERERAMHDSREAERAERTRLLDAIQRLLERQDRAEKALTMHVEEIRRLVEELRGEITNRRFKERP